MFSRTTRRLPLAGSDDRTVTLADDVVFHGFSADDQHFIFVMASRHRIDMHATIHFGRRAWWRERTPALRGFDTTDEE